MKNRERKVLLAHVPCECGGELAPYMVDSYDATAELGIPITIIGRVPGLHCESCRTFAVSIAVLRLVAEKAADILVRLPRVLSGVEAQFLRKAVLGCSQEDLAQKLNLSRPTIARWEAAASLAPEQDFNFRGFLIGRMLAGERLRGTRSTKARLDLARTVLSGARLKLAPKRIPRLQIAA